MTVCGLDECACVRLAVASPGVTGLGHTGPATGHVTVDTALPSPLTVRGLGSGVGGQGRVAGIAWRFSFSRDRGNSVLRVEPAPAVAGSSAPLPTPSLQDLTRLFLSLSGPFVQLDAVGASLFAGVIGAWAFPDPAAPVTSSAPLACMSGSVPASGGLASVSAASMTGSSGRHEHALESPHSERRR